MINETSIVQTASDVNLVIGTYILAGITLAGIIITSLLTRSQLRKTEEANTLLRLELESKLRPLFQIKTSYASLVNNPIHVVFSITLSNQGELPARHIVVYDWESNNYEIQHIIKEKPTNSYLPLGTLQKNATTNLQFTIKWDENKTSTHYVIWFEFRYLDKKERVVVVFKIVTGVNNLEHEWFVEDDIQEAEKRWNDEKSGKIFAPTK